MKSKINFIILAASILCSGYIIMMVYFPDFLAKIDFPGFLTKIDPVQFFGELLTIPVILSLVGLFIFNIWNWSKNSFKLMSLNFLILLLHLGIFSIMLLAD